MTKLAPLGGPVFALALGALWATAVHAQSPVESSFAEARSVLARAMAAHGGVERIQKLQTARLDLKGEISTGIQGRSAEGVARTAPEGEFETHIAIDLDKGRSRTMGEQRGNDSYVFPFTALYKEGAVHFLNQYPPQDTRMPVTDADEGREQTAGIGTRMAVPVVLKLASQRMGGLRSEGSATVGGRSVQRISFNVDKNTRVTLSIDKDSGRVAGLEQLAADPLLGVDTTRWTYHGTQTVDGMVLPERATVARRGITILDIKITGAQFDDTAKVADADFAIDPKYQPFEPPGLSIAEVRPGLWEVANAGQGNYRVHFVELADRLIAYDAPVSPTEVRNVIAKLREKVPGKPISHVVLSHFHDDHVSGVKGFAEAGATIVTTADAQPIVKRIAEAQMRIGSVVDQPVPALKFALVNGQLELGDKDRKVTVFETRGDPHVDRLLVLADGGSKAVIAADAYSDTMPFNAVFDWMAQWIQSNQPATELLLGAHHPAAPTTTLFTRQAEFRAAGKKTALR
jgi:glyoxylase-like metal-dependent hydrolase (beta-lactamase superfamily II)